MNYILKLFDTPLISFHATEDSTCDISASQGHFRHDFSAPKKTLLPRYVIDILTEGNILQGIPNI